MPSAEKYTAQQAEDLFVAWPVGGGVLDDPPALRPLLAGVDALVRLGLLEQCRGWPPERSTDGIIPYRCTRTDDRTIEVIGMCWAFSAGRGGFGTFPIRANLTVSAHGEGLSSFRCDVGNIDRETDSPIVFPGGSMILVPTDEDTDAPGPYVTVGRRLHAIAWTPVIDYGDNEPTDDQ